MTWDIDAPPGQTGLERSKGRPWRVLSLACVGLGLVASTATITVVVQRVDNPSWAAWAWTAAGCFVASWAFAWAGHQA